MVLVEVAELDCPEPHHRRDLSQPTQEPPTCKPLTILFGPKLPGPEIRDGFSWWRDFMKYLFSFLLCLASLSAFAQGPIIRQPLTTNRVMNAPSDGTVPFWNATAGQWSNAIPNAATATNAQPPSTILTNISQTGAITNIDEGNKLYVRTNGNNSTAVRGRADKPWAHITNAFANSVAGDWIDVDGGTYNIPTNTTSLAKTGIRWNFRGTKITSGLSADGDDRFLFDDFAGPVTDFAILGSGSFYISNLLGRVFYFQDSGSDVLIQARVARTTGAVGALHHSAGNVYAEFSEELRSDQYDAYLNEGDPNTSKIYLRSPRVVGGDSSIEVARAFEKAGDGVFDIGYAQGFFNLVDNMIANVSTINLQTNFTIYGAAVLGNGILQNSYVYGASNRTLSLIHPPVDGFKTDGYFRNVIFSGSSNRNAILVNSTVPMTFDNCRIVDGWGATNSIWATNAQSIRVHGTLVAPARWNSNVSITEGTNILSGFLNMGKGTNSGEMLIGGLITAFAGLESRSGINVTAGDVDVTGNGAFTGFVTVADDAYAAGWNGSTEVPTKNALYDKIETIVAGSGSPGGAQPMLQMNLGGAFVGTTNLTYDNSNNILRMAASALGDALIDIKDAAAPNATNRIGSQFIGMRNNYGFGIRNNDTNNWLFGQAGNLTPATDNYHAIGSPALRVLGSFSTLSNNVLVKPSIAPPGAGGLVHLNGTNNNWFVSATTNALLVLTNIKVGSDYTLSVSNGANVVVTLSNAAAIKVPGLPAGQFPGFNTNGFTYMTFRVDDISGSTNLVSFSSKERSLIVGNGFLMTTNAVTDEVSIWGGHFTNSVVTGVGGANTNFTLVLPYDLSFSINGFTNVSIRAVMGYDTTRRIYWSGSVSNLSGSNRTFEFSGVTNNVVWSGVYGTNAPTTLTNGFSLELAGYSQGTNTMIGYTYIRAF